MPITKEKHKVRYLPVHTGFYHSRFPVHRYTFDSDIQEDFKHNIKLVTKEIKEQSQPDFNTALFSALLGVLLASYAEKMISHTLENKLNEQLIRIFK